MEENESLKSTSVVLSNEEQPAKFSGIKPFLEAVITASNRSRFVVLVLSSASILAFVGFWNSRPNNWLNLRITFASATVEYLKARNSVAADEARLRTLQAACVGQRSVATESTAVNTQRSLNQSESRGAKAITTANTAQNAMVKTEPNVCREMHELNNHILLLKDALRQKRFESVRAQFEMVELNSGIFKSPDNPQIQSEMIKAEEDLKLLLKMKRENSTIFRVPFFGTSFDVNDLSMISGLTFSVILIWLRLSLWTELNSTYQVFERVKEHELIDCYEYLSMHLVFTIPKSADTELRKFSEKQWKWVVLSIIFLPAAVQLMVLINDLYTVEVGVAVSLVNTIMILLIGFVSFAITTVLTVSCVILTISLNKLWRAQGSRIQDWKMKQGQPSAVAEPN